jgi:Ca-activated chloride channel family protein
MNFTEFEFANPLWFWALLVPIIIFLLASVRRKYFPSLRRLQKFADPHLLPHLMMNPSPTVTSKTLTRLLSQQGLWMVLWLLGVLALAGPRWDYEEQAVVRSNANLMILLDLSKSMRVKDLSYARFEQARQEIEEIIEHKENIYIGLMVFAGIPHLVVPFTDDYDTLRHLLDEIKIDLLPIQGSRLALAFEAVIQWLKGQETQTLSHVLLISDGDFESDDLQASLAILKEPEKFFYLHTLGVGTQRGDFVPDEDGKWQRDKQGDVVISRLNEKALRQLASAGNGIYYYATYHNQDTQAILTAVKRSIDEPTEDKKMHRLWHERFYLLVVLMMILILPWFRSF